MSEQSNSGFPFAEVPGGEGLDIDAIFGGAPNGAAPGEVNPFEAALPQQPTPAASIPQGQPQAATPAEQPQPVPQSAQQPAASAPAVFQSVQSVQPAPAIAPAAALATQPPLDIDPLAAAMAEQEAKTEQKAAKSLFEKAPVFHTAAPGRTSPTPE